MEAQDKTMPDAQAWKIAVCEALGFNPAKVSRIVIDIRADSPIPTVHVEQIAIALEVIPLNVHWLVTTGPPLSEPPPSEPPQLTLGGLIAALEAMPIDTQVANLHGPHSYRGSYDELAFEIEGGATRLAKDLLEHCLAIARGERIFTGYKGGSYQMGLRTPVWVAEHGELGDMIVAMHRDGSITTRPDTE